jgi:hypothetical protein
LAESPIRHTYSNSSPEVKVLIGFIFSRRKLYNLAREVLEEAISEVEISSGSTSLEYGLVAAELATCCNITQEEARGEHWARHALSERSESDASADTYYLKIALADSLLAASCYKAAIEVLQGVLESRGLDPSIGAKAIIRLVKARRLMGDTLPSESIRGPLVQGTRLLEDISTPLRAALCEEIFCNIDKLDAVDEKFVRQVEGICSAFDSLGTSGDQMEFDTFRDTQLEDLLASFKDMDLQFTSDGKSRLSSTYLGLLSIY